MLHDLIPAPEAPKIIRLLCYEVDVADERIADVEKEAGLDLLLACCAAIFVKLSREKCKGYSVRGSFGYKCSGTL